MGVGGMLKNSFCLERGFQANLALKGGGGVTIKLLPKPNFQNIMKKQVKEKLLSFCKLLKIFTDSTMKSNSTYGFGGLCVL